MTKQTEALRMAIAEMVRAEKVFDDIGLLLIKFGVKPSDISFHKESFLAPSIQACKEALEQPAQYDLIQGEPLDADDDGLYYVPKQPAQEPVAWLSEDSKANEIIKTHPAPSWQGNKEFVGLSDDERFIIVQNADWDNPYDIAELIEQELKDKNT